MAMLLGRSDECLLCWQGGPKFRSFTVQECERVELSILVSFIFLVCASIELTSEMSILKYLAPEVFGKHAHRRVSGPYRQLDSYLRGRLILYVSSSVE